MVPTNKLVPKQVFGIICLRQSITFKSKNHYFFLSHLARRGCMFGESAVQRFWSYRCSIRGLGFRWDHVHSGSEAQQGRKTLFLTKQKSHESFCSLYWPSSTNPQIQNTTHSPNMTMYPSNMALRGARLWGILLRMTKTSFFNLETFGPRKPFPCLEMVSLELEIVIQNSRLQSQHGCFGT